MVANILLADPPKVKIKLSQNTGSEIKLAFTINASENFKMRGQIFVQENFCECKSIDPNIESQSACFSVV